MKPSLRREFYWRHHEWLLVVLMMLVFIGVATVRIWDLRVAAERTGVEQMLGAMRAGLGQRLLEIAMHGRPTEIAALAGEDPGLFLNGSFASYAELQAALAGKDPGRRPDNYVRLQAPLDPSAMKPFQWYFDPSDGILTYRVGNETNVETALPGPRRLRFRIQVLYADRNGNGRFDEATETLSRAELVALEPYRWRDPREYP